MSLPKTMPRRKFLLGAIVLFGLLMLIMTPALFAAKIGSLSIKTNARVLTSGKSLFIKGRLVTSNGRAIKSRTVVLQKKDVRRKTKRVRGRLKRVKQRYWRNLGRRKTNRRGIYSFGLKPRKSATYRVRSTVNIKRTHKGSSSASRNKRLLKKAIVSSAIRVTVRARLVKNMRNRLGFAVGNNLVGLSDQELARQLDGMAAIGVRWIRHDMQWSIIQPDNSTNYNWGPYDRLVREANKRNIKILPILTYTPRWARTPSASGSMFAAPANNAQFATFAGNTVRHYAPIGVRAWEIWNEPNITPFWKPAPNASAYTDLLKKSYVSIKKADPGATVVSGGLSPATTSQGNIAPRDFVSRMYANGVKGYFNVLGHHPYTFPALPSSYYDWSAWSQMSSTKPNLRSIMASHGDNKPIWATESGMPTKSMGGVSESLQAKSIKNAAQLMKNRPWLGKVFIYSYKDIGTSTNTIENFFGVVRYDGSYKPGYYTVKNILAH